MEQKIGRRKRTFGDYYSGTVLKIRDHSDAGELTDSKYQMRLRNKAAKDKQFCDRGTHVTQ